MCGIAGIISSSSDQKQISFLKKMTDALAHRGPDGEGFWSNAASTVFLGHRRLAIIDLSDNAVQPMPYLNRYTIIHNGEIYNYIEIKDFLLNKGYQFKSQTDTEIIAAAYDFWKEDCLNHLDGMFAFAIWDEKEQQLFAARDRFGEKPFYYYNNHDCFLFASEMKALWAAGVEKTIENKMLLNFLTLGHVQNSTDKEITFFENIFSLPPAHYLQFNTATFKLKVTSYWTLNKETKIDINAADAIEKFTSLFNTSVKRRLRSDVALGSSLSGGLDSSSIIASLAAFNSDHSSFSAVFPGYEKDESSYIQSIVDQFQLSNFQVTPTADGLLTDFEKLCYHQEEPFQSSSIYAQYKVYELARQHDIKVVLDGQGADETLAGYHKYIHWYLQEMLSSNKLGATRHERKALQKNNVPFQWDVRNIFSAFLPAHAAIYLEKREYHKTTSHPYINKDFIKSSQGMEWDGIHKPVITKLNDILHFNTIEMGLEELLRFADRNSMAHGVEVRLPFLNHKLVEFIFSLPANYKIHDGWTKWLLRKVMNKKLPSTIVWRTDKIGYEPPQKIWMEDKRLQEYMYAAKSKLVAEKILTPKILHKKIVPQAAHAENNFDWRYLSAAATLF